MSALAGVEDGYPDNFIAVVAQDDVVLGEFAVGGDIRFPEVDVEDIGFVVVRGPEATAGDCRTAGNILRKSAIKLSCGCEEGKFGRPPVPLGDSRYRSCLASSHNTNCHSHGTKISAMKRIATPIAVNMAAPIRGPTMAKTNSVATPNGSA